MTREIAASREAAAYSGQISLIVGGLILIGTPFVSYSSPIGYALLVVGFALGFAGLIYASVRLTNGARNSQRAAFMLASIAWTLGWSWQFHVGLVLYLPVGAWGVIASAAFIAAAVMSLRDHGALRVVMFALLAAGSILSTVIALANPIFSPQHLFAPLAVSAVLAGVLWVVDKPAAGRSSRPEPV